MAVLGDATFKDSNGDFVVRELLPYIQPHDGVLRVQLHRRRSNVNSAEELRFIFAFRCGKCDHSTSEGVQADISFLAAGKHQSAVQGVLNQISNKLRDFCERVREYPCVNTMEMARYSEVITSLLGTLGAMSEEELISAVEQYENDLDTWNARKVAKQLGFLGDDGVYRLPSDHPLNRQGGPGPTPRPPNG